MTTSQDILRSRRQPARRNLLSKLRLPHRKDNLCVPVCPRYSGWNGISLYRRLGTIGKLPLDALGRFQQGIEHSEVLTRCKTESYTASMATRHRGKDSNVWQWLYDQGEERLTQMAEELAKNKTLTDALARALRQAAHTKGRLDKNMQNVLGLLNVPSRADYVKLLTKLEMLQGSLVNVNMKLDRILAGMAPPRKSRRAAAGKPAAEE